MDMVSYGSGQAEGHLPDESAGRWSAVMRAYGRRSGVELYFQGRWIIIRSPALERTMLASSLMSGSDSLSDGRVDCVMTNTSGFCNRLYDMA